ncbi:HI_0552 family protein [Alysiella crassa]|uniref:Glucose-6-phosphate 1-dehydrogenase n=1 Tax=Alysiella crassa TaxID=153491 RepID=A0A376BTX9_9NEIS|nr:HI_0552 family protein [Alysiella crassa]UOP05832.1 glucose-6-phosphate 1-dehydrogenase family protein [Alysiella crassa]SSY80253.1 Glucose-6-phosphate 1-dehydrogenase [Alysiella crassa]
MLTPQHCDLFNRPFFQFAQLKQYAPETIPQLKADYKAAWNDWKTLILQAHETLTQANPQFAAPHIERWCNGWQVRAHFFAYFKYAAHTQDAAIISLLLNRKRLTVSLDWHCYKADVSTIALPDYNRWLDNLDAAQYADFDLWHGAASEYADYATVRQQPAPQIHHADDFFCLGKHIPRDDLTNVNALNFIVNTVEELLPLYEHCFQAA